MDVAARNRRRPNFCHCGHSSNPISKQQSVSPPKLRCERAGRRGAALIVSLSVLVVLSLLATVFAGMAEVERTISRNYVDDVRARMLAETGIQEAVARIRRAMERGEDLNRNGVLDPGEDADGNGRLDASWPSFSAWRYHGEDRNANGVLDPGEDVDGDGRLDLLDCPLEDALRPSFAVLDAGGPSPPGAGRPARRIWLQEPTGARPSSASGALAASAYVRNGDQHLLKIVDTSAQIHLNDRNPNLARILNNLSVYLGGPRDLGTRLVARRPPGGYASKHDPVARGAVSADEFARVRDYVAVHAWVDADVVNPVPLSEYEHVRPGSPYLVGNGFGEYWRPAARGTYRNGKTIYRYGPGFALNPDIQKPMTGGGRKQLRFATTYDSASAHPEAWVYGVDELNPQWIETTSRAPVNVNTAPKEVLMALIEGLDGFYLVERSRATRGGYAWTRRQELPGTGYRDVLPGGTAGPVMTPSIQGGSEIGGLYRTEPIPGPAGTSSGGARGRLAEILARKIIDYRSGRNVLPGGTGGLPDVPEGPFLSWAQFNEFLDQLLLQDAEVRGAMMEGVTLGWPAHFPERAVHVQARMDVLKANFNPNLHLNEANPDECLSAWVDKTDLVVASTEFCFTPMGIFEVESLGRVVRPSAGGGTDALAPGAAVEALAEKKIAATLRIYDAVRESTQRKFYGDRPALAGTPKDSALSPAPGGTAQTTTNYGYALQTMPEPDNGDAPYDAEYEGYLALSTYGGVPSLRKPKHAVVTNLPGTSPSVRATARYGRVVSTANAPGAPPGAGGAQSALREWMRAHFDYDFNLRYSETQDSYYTVGGSPIAWAGERRVHQARRFERSQGTAAASRLHFWFNSPAPSETIDPDPSNVDRFRRSNLRGPYCLGDIADGLAAPNYDAIAPRDREFRLARSFRVDPPSPQGGSAAWTPRPVDAANPAVPFHHYAPTGLRGDGGYSERNNVPLWSPTRAEGIPYRAPVNVFQGVVSYWLKPNFRPELSGKFRSFFSIGGMRGDLGTEPGFMNPGGFTHYFSMSHHGTGVPPTYLADGGGPNLSNGPARCFLFGYGFSDASGHLPGTGAAPQFPGSGAKPVVAGVVSRSLNEIPLTPAWGTDARTLPEARCPLAANKWIHVTLVWRLNPENPADPFTGARKACEILVNGRPSQSSAFWERGAGQRFPADPRLCFGCGLDWGLNVADPWNGPPGVQGHHSYHWFWDKVDRNGRQWNPTTPSRASNQPPAAWVNPVRLGEPTSLTPLTRSGERYSRNFSSDATYDEFYLWGDADPSAPQNGRAGALRLWRQGRYYRGNDGWFRSRTIDLGAPMARRMAPGAGSTAATAGPAAAPPAPGVPGAPGSGSWEVVGVAWTQLAKKYDSSRPADPAAPGGNRFLQYDHAAADPETRPIPAGAELLLSPDDGAAWFGPRGRSTTTANRLRDDGWAIPYEDAARTRRVRLPALAGGTRLKYQVFLRLAGPNFTPSSILLETPVFDDVTIYYTDGEAQVLDWVVM